MTDAAATNGSLDKWMTQEAPWPTALVKLVAALTYKPSWSFHLQHLDRGQGSVGLTLEVVITTADSYHPEHRRSVVHYFPVPPAAYDARSWQRWLFDCLIDVETHECCEFFTLDGDKPYAPSHGPGNDPYLVRELGDDLDRRTSSRGEVKPDIEEA